jgi:hypothetical protein
VLILKSFKPVVLEVRILKRIVASDEWLVERGNVARGPCSVIREERTGRKRSRRGAGSGVVAGVRMVKDLVVSGEWRMVRLRKEKISLGGCDPTPGCFLQE